MMLQLLDFVTDKIPKGVDQLTDLEEVQRILCPNLFNWSGKAFVALSPKRFLSSTGP